MIAAIEWPALVSLVVVLLAAVVVPILWPRLAAWQRDRRQCVELARGSGLDAGETRVVWRLARLATPQLPLAVFVRPSLWDVAVARTGASPAIVDAIRTKLFG